MMARHLRMALGLALTAVLLPRDVTAQVEDYRDITYPSLPEFTIPEPTRVELKNGMVLYLLEDHELPLISLFGRVRTGAHYEPAEKVGLAPITGQVMREGGTTSLPGDEMDRILETMAASVEVGIGGESASVSMSSLKKDVDRALTIFADVLMHPAFPEDKLDLAQTQHRSAIARRNDNVGAIASREFAKLIYGPDSPLARHTEYATIEAVTRDDLVAFHRRYFHPNNTILGVVGDFKAREMRRKIERAFKDWKPQPTEYPERILYRQEPNPAVHYIEKTDVTQTNLRLGHLGTTINNPDYFALVVMSNVFGSGFSSRLFSRIRSQQGLAYHISGSFGADFIYPGTFTISGETKLESTLEAIRAVLKEIEAIREGPIEDEEVELAKARILEGFVFNFDTAGEIVSRQITYEYYDYPRDFLQQFRDRIETVTVADVQRVARQYLKPGALTILAVGDSTKFDAPLSTLGEVSAIDIAIPEPRRDAPEATPETLARGETLLNRAVAEAGGAEALAGVETLSARWIATVQTPQGAMEVQGTSRLAFPNRLHQEMTLPFGTLSMVYDGEQGWMAGPQGTQPLPPSQTQEMAKEVARNLLSLLRRAAQGELTAQLLPSEEVNGKETQILLIRSEDGLEVELGVHPQTGRVAFLRYQGQGPQGPATMVEQLADFRQVDGLTLPFRQTVLQDGNLHTERVVEELLLNPKLGDELFQKPE